VTLTEDADKLKVTANAWANTLRMCELLFGFTGILKPATLTEKWSSNSDACWTVGEKSEGVGEGERDANAWIGDGVGV
jgi:hypothetical protein